MTAILDVRAETESLTRSLDDLARKQIPFATATALTAVAKAARTQVTAQLPSIFDRPNPFTMRAIGTTPARKTDLTATVFVRDKQAEYLAVQETGGTVLPKKQALVLPVEIRTNQYGNIPRGALARAKARKSVFVGKVHGVGGFWQRKPGDKLSLLAEFKPQIVVKPIFGFVDRVTQVVNKELPNALADALAKALATAKSK